MTCCGLKLLRRLGSTVISLVVHAAVVLMSVSGGSSALLAESANVALRADIEELSDAILGPNAQIDFMDAFVAQAEIDAEISVTARFRDREEQTLLCDEMADYGGRTFICRIFLTPEQGDNRYWVYTFSDFGHRENVCLTLVDAGTGAGEQRGCNLDIPFAWIFAQSEGYDPAMPIVLALQLLEGTAQRETLDARLFDVGRGLLRRVADLRKAEHLISFQRKKQSFRFDWDFNTSIQPSSDEVPDAIEPLPSTESLSLTCRTLAWGPNLQLELYFAERKLNGLWSKAQSQAYAHTCYDEIYGRVRNGDALGVYSEDTDVRSNSVRRACRKTTIVEETNEDFLFDCHALSLTQKKYSSTYQLEEWVFHHRGHDADFKSNDCVSVTRSNLDGIAQQSGPKTKKCDENSVTAFLPY